MLLTDFAYDLPTELIAQEQAVPRDSARLMLINRSSGEISHHHVSDLPKLLPPDYFIVANNTKVFPARLMGHKSTGGKVEILLTQPLGHSSYLCISKPGLKLGDIVRFQGSDLEGRAQPPDSKAGRSDPTGYERVIKFNQEESMLRTTLSTIGTMPTPPYIKKLLGNSKDYQTIYAKYGFSAAAPTAGLHFTPQLLKDIKVDHSWNELTLNVGLGTFLPVKENDIQNHHMHSESYTISPTAASAINKQRSDLCLKLLSIGTTTMRALESNAALPPSSHSSDLRAVCSGAKDRSELLRSGSFSTNIFIYPPYKFQLVDALMTNFHLPGSTLLMLVSAFCSSPNSNEKFTNFADSLLGRAYAIAIKEKYRFFSFGDAMLII
jgi:S-adenosylmethionine:tRNA ribosyltransferase-isomerase